jgi:acyl-CoA reductase-like NAD-dependent aldehyde dehydrogenase
MAIAVFRAIDPRTGEPGPEHVQSSPAEVAGACEAAADAALDPALRNHARRASLLRDIAGRLKSAGDEIVDVCERETGLSRERLRRELGHTRAQLEAFGALLYTGDHVEATIELSDPQARPRPKPDIRRILTALGPVAVFGARSLPLSSSTAGSDTASALAAGCPVVVKGHPGHPSTAVVVAREVSAAVADAGLPAGTFALLQGPGPSVGEALVEDPHIAAVGFTGSLRTGRLLLDRAAARPVPIPVYAQMSSVNPVIVTEAALRARSEAIAEQVFSAITESGGQVPTKPGLIFLARGDGGDAFCAALTERLAQHPPSVLLGERVRDALDARLDEIASTRGVRAVGGATAAADAPGILSPARVFELTAATLLEHDQLQDECLGPVVLLVRCASMLELVSALQALRGQLTASIFHEQTDTGLLTTLAEVLGRRVGRLVFDDLPIEMGINHGMVHGGPYPASSASTHTSVGLTAIRRWLRPIAFQDAPQNVLPPELRDANPLGLWRRVEGAMTRAALRSG